MQGEEAPGCNWTGWIGLVISVVVLACQLVVLQRYSLQWPNSLWTGETLWPLNHSCEEVFWVMHWCAFLMICMLPLEIFFLVTNCIPMVQALCTPCLLLAAPVLCVLGLVKFFLAAWGFLVLFFLSSMEVEACYDLYRCAWWCYHGLLVATLLLCCCGCCLGITAVNVYEKMVETGPLAWGKDGERRPLREP